MFFSVMRVESLCPRLRLDNAHWHAAHGKRRSANGKDGMFTAGGCKHGRTSGK